MCSFFHALFHLLDALAELVSDGSLLIGLASLASEDSYCISKCCGFVSPEILASNGLVCCFHESYLILIIDMNRWYSDIKDLLDDSKRKRIVVCYPPEVVEVRFIIEIFLVELFQLGDVVTHFVAPMLYHKGKVF